MFTRQFADPLYRILGSQGRVHQFDGLDAGILHVGEDLRQDRRDVVFRLRGRIDPGMPAYNHLARGWLGRRQPGGLRQTARGDCRRRRCEEPSPRNPAILKCWHVHPLHGIWLPKWRNLNRLRPAILAYTPGEFHFEAKGPLGGSRRVIHYIPFRGWTYNLWGFACVKLTLGRKIVRVGTDDADELAKVVREKMGRSGLFG